VWGLPAPRPSNQVLINQPGKIWAKKKVFATRAKRVTIWHLKRDVTGCPVKTAAQWAGKKSRGKKHRAIWKGGAICKNKKRKVSATIQEFFGEKKGALKKKNPDLWSKEGFVGGGKRNKWLTVRRRQGWVTVGEISIFSYKEDAPGHQTDFGPQTTFREQQTLIMMFCGWLGLGTNELGLQLLGRPRGHQSR